MLAEIIIGVIGVSQAKKNLKTAKINRQMMVMNGLSKGLANMGSNQEVRDFISEYRKVNKELKEESLWT